jgi:hypothetical protein
MLRRPIGKWGNLSFNQESQMAFFLCLSMGENMKGTLGDFQLRNVSQHMRAFKDTPAHRIAPFEERFTELEKDLKTSQSSGQ